MQTVSRFSHRSRRHFPTSALVSEGTPTMSTTLDSATDPIAIRNRLFGGDAAMTLQGSVPTLRLIGA